MSTNVNATASPAGSSSPNGSTIATLPAEVRCSYPSKLCNNHRAVKDNGDLHKLCDFHRKKANVNQQRMQQKRRLIRQQMIERKKRFMDAGMQAQGGIMFPAEAVAAMGMSFDAANQPICNLTQEEVMMLEVMLFDDEDDQALLSSDDLVRFADMPMVDGAAFQSFPAANMTL